MSNNIASLSTFGLIASIATAVILGLWITDKRRDGTLARAGHNMVDATLNPKVTVNISLEDSDVQ